MKVIYRMLVVTLLVLSLCMTGTLAAPTTEVTVVKINSETDEIMSRTTVTYQWMEENLPVHGDGITRYYHQGPVFDGDKWDPEETTNFKDKGSVKGTDIRDLCDLVGGAAPGDEIMVRAQDGYHVEFPYENVYHPEPRQGPIVLTWYNGADPDVGERQGTGYPPDFYSGMRIVFFADTSTNTDGLHVYGNDDMKKTMPQSVHHFYDLYPSTNGFTVKWVDEIRVYSGGYKGEQGLLAKSLQSEPGHDAQQSPMSSLIVFIAITGCSILYTRRGMR
ncbi:argininosuccinate synthase [Methanocalculus chunghsingensis]|uniref:Argininosuccinate synthase n=2 Tax=Methanocalculus chunghsingensis TaxID=156457 RepID=A0A8J7W5G2_9EURY|nr:argininosuccinate synthase [Methanocalculus chunghsingensis]